MNHSNFPTLGLQSVEMSLLARCVHYDDGLVSRTTRFQIEVKLFHENIWERHLEKPRCIIRSHQESFDYFSLFELPQRFLMQTSILGVALP